MPRAAEQPAKGSWNRGRQRYNIFAQSQTGERAIDSLFPN